jgi:phosphatidylglycerophosphatase C
MSSAPEPVDGRPVPLRIAAPRPLDPVAVWDVDGTLTRADTMLPFLRRVAGPAAVTAALVPAIGLHLTGTGRRVEAKAALLRRVLGGRVASDVDRVAREYAEHVVRHRMRSDAVRRWQWHRRHGHRLVLVSASLDLYLRHLGEHLGADEVICTRMAVVGGRLTGEMSGTSCRGPEKAVRLADYLQGHPGNPVRVYADSAADRPMMMVGDIPVQVRTRNALYEFIDPPLEVDRPAEDVA